MTQHTPNILWICTDQQRYDTIRTLGCENIETPHIDRLVQEGVAFLRAYSQSPICTPSRASFLTGRYPNTLHVNRNGDAWFPDKPGLITRKLRDAGYDCGLSGKLHLTAAHGRVEQFADDLYGYRVIKWSHHPNPEDYWPTTQHDYQQWLVDNDIDWDLAFNADLNTENGSEWNVPGVCRPGITAEYHQTKWCVDEAISFISEEREGPWLMSINPFDPHPAFDPPLSYLERMDVASMPMPLFKEEELQSQLAFAGIDHQTEVPRSPFHYDAQRMVAAYYAQIELIDDQVGRLLDVLENSGQRKNTIIIYGFSAIIIAFLFRPLLSRIDRWTEKIFFREKYEFHTAVGSLMEAMIAVRNPKEIFTGKSGFFRTNIESGKSLGSL